MDHGPDNLSEKLLNCNKYIDKDHDRIRHAWKAYRTRDPEKSRQAHVAHSIQRQNREKEVGGTIPHVEPDSCEGNYIKPMVFGGLDGVGTSFALLAGSVGTDLNFIHMIAICSATIFASALSMGFGEYISSKAEREIALRELARERWEVEVYPEGEVAEMVDIYRKKGVSEEDAMTVANVLSKYKEFWVEHMLLHELNILPPCEDSFAESLKQALVMFISFAIFGMIPIIVYGCLISIFGLAVYTCFMISVGIAIGSLFFLGALKSYMSESNCFLGGLVMAIQGSVSGGTAYGIGYYVQVYMNMN